MPPPFSRERGLDLLIANLFPFTASASVINPLVALAATGSLYWPIARGFRAFRGWLAALLAQHAGGDCRDYSGPVLARGDGAHNPVRWSAAQVTLTAVALAAILLLRGPSGSAVVPIFGLLVSLQSDKGPVARRLVQERRSSWGGSPTRSTRS